MKAEVIKAGLDKVYQGELHDIFNLLPEVAGGEHWLGEIKDCADRMKDYLTDGDDYDIDDIRDLGWQFADSECEDYYSNINKRVQDLSLWASNDLDAEVQELMRPNPTLTDLNSAYLYCAMRQLWDAVADQVFENIEEGEE